MRGKLVKRGITLYKSNHGLCMEIYYTADPRAERKAMEAKKTLHDSIYRREYLIDWSVAGGDLIFRQMMEDYRHLIITEPFPIPQDWPVFHGLDWGWASESAIIEGAFDPKNEIVYIVWECYRTGMYLQEIADAIMSRPRYGGRNYLGVWADPSMFRVSTPTQKGQSTGIAQALSEFGLPLERARVSPVERLQRILSAWADLAEGYSGLVIFDECENLINELYNLRYDEKYPDRADKSLPDHAYDALGYGLMAVRHLYSREVTELPFECHTDDINSTIFWKTQWEEQQKRKYGPQPRIRSVRDILAYNRLKGRRGILGDEEFSPFYPEG